VPSGNFQYLELATNSDGVAAATYHPGIWISRFDPASNWSAELELGGGDSVTAHRQFETSAKLGMLRLERL
jgi:hypothetical protein